MWKKKKEKNNNITFNMNLNEFFRDIASEKFKERNIFSG